MTKERRHTQFVDDGVCPEFAFDRRDVIKLGTALVAGVSVIGINDAAATAQENPAKLPLQPGDRFQIIRGALKNKFLQPDMLEVGSKPFEAFPFDPTGEMLRRRNRLNRVLVLQLDPDEMDDKTRERSVEGVLAYSALCTHRACTIKSWKAKERNLRCHCHLSEFAALAEGGVVRGPAKRQLPMVPLSLDDDGFVIAVDGFTGKPGGGQEVVA
ncbi:MAG: Rieske (2Fe-2S) protein [Hyphomicrobiaceae bacterium]